MKSIPSFTFRSPRGVFFGVGELAKVKELVAPFERVMVVTEKNMAQTPHLPLVKSLLVNKLFEVYEYTSTPPDLPGVNAAFEVAKQLNPDVLISLGGSSTTDGTKAIAQRLNWPTHISIPTTYGGSEATHGFAVFNPETNTKQVVSVPECMTTYVIYDPRLTITLPRDVTAASGMNSLAHCIEAYYCSSNPIARTFCAIGIDRIMKGLPKCVEDPSNLEARTEMQFGSYAAGTAVCNGSVGLHHGICYFIAPAYGISHGQANSIMLPYVMQYNLDAIPAEMAEIAKMMGLDVGGKTNIEAGQMAVDKVVELAEKIGVPRRLSVFGAKEDTFEELARRALPSRGVQNNPKPIRSPQQIVELLKMAL